MIKMAQMKNWQVGARERINDAYNINIMVRAKSRIDVVFTRSDIFCMNLFGSRVCVFARTRFAHSTRISCRHANSLSIHFSSYVSHSLLFMLLFSFSSFLRDSGLHVCMHSLVWKLSVCLSSTFVLTHTQTLTHAHIHSFIRSNFFRYMDFDWFIPSSYTCVSSLFTSPIIQHYGSSRYAIVCRLHNALWATTLLYLCWVVFLFFSLFN